MSAGYLGFEKKNGSNPWLDLIRAVAITLVLLRHGQRAFPSVDTQFSLFTNVALNGWIGVDLFFVLSGYLITRHLLANYSGVPHLGFRQFVIARALRIIPAYYAVLALIIAGAFPFYEVQDQLLTVRVIYHLLFLQDYLPANINVAFWSLAVEEKFYLTAPLLVALAGGIRGARSSIVAVLCVGALSIPLRSLSYSSISEQVTYDMFFQFSRSPFHACLEPLVLGTAIGLADRAHLLSNLSLFGGRLFTASALAFALWLGSHEFLGTINWFDASLQPTLNAALCGVLVLSAAALHGRRMACEPPVRMVARLSYSLYLVHFPLLPLAKRIAEASEGGGGLLFWAAYIGLSFAAAGLLHFTVEKPFLLAKDWLLQDRGRRSLPIPQNPEANAQAAVR